MKQFKPVLISAAALVIVALLAFVVMKLFPEIAPEKEMPSDVPEDTFIQILDKDASAVSSIEFIDGEAGGFVIDYTAAEIGINATLRGAHEGLLYDEYEMTTLPSFLSTLAALEEIGEEDPSLFGFDAPKRKITLTFKDGSSETILIGDDLPVEEGVYVKTESGSKVYTIGKTAKERVMIQRKDFLSYVLFPTIEKVNELTEIEYTPYGKAPIKLSRRGEEEVKKDAERMGISINYALSSPVSALASPDTLDEVLLSKIIAIEGMAVVEEAPSDLAKYGLDKPAKLKFETNTGISASLLIGGESELGGNYVMLENAPAVIETLAPIGLSDLEHTDITLKLIFYFNSNEISSLEYAFSDGRRHLLDIHLDEHIVKGSLDGVELPGRNAANIFQRTISFSLAGEAPQADDYGKPELTVNAKLTDGRVKTLSLYRLNERQYAAEVDGKRAEFYVPVAEVRDLTEAIEMAKRGEEIPDMF